MYSYDDILMSILQWVPLLPIITYFSLQNLQMFIIMNFKIILWICEFLVHFLDFSFISEFKLKFKMSDMNQKYR